MERENYVEIKGFYDLREYNIPDKIFIKLWRIQKYLKHVEDHKLYFKKLNVNLWEKAKVLSGEYQQVLASFAQQTGGEDGKQCIFKNPLYGK